MQIEFESTPPQRSKLEDLSTPPKKHQNGDEFSTPPKKQQNNADQFSTPPRNENPQSKRIYEPTYKGTPISELKRVMLSNIKSSPNSSSKKIPEFVLSRLDQDYEVLKTLGEGSFSSVYLCQSRLTGDLVAIKETKMSSMSINQVMALGTLSIFAEKSRNIVRYYHSWSEEARFYIVMEYCESNLTRVYNQYRSSKHKISEAKLKDFLKQCLSGLSCMHANRIVHLDIKPDNLLFRDQTLKIADLGLCRVTRIKKWSELEEGDSRYLAREVLNYHEGIDLTKADVFSLGIAIYEGMSLEILPNNGEKWSNIRQFGLQLGGVSSYSKELTEIVKLMTQPNWEDRPSAASIIKMPYFQSKVPHRRNFLLGKSRRQDRNPRKEQSSL